MAGLQVYVDTSVVLRRLLSQSGAIENWSDWRSAVASELVHVEAMRTFDRLRLSGSLSGSQLADLVAELATTTAGFEQVPVDRFVLRRASSPLPVPLGTLDAIHLATALIWTESNSQDLTFLTHDRQLVIAARACGVEAATSL